MLTSSIGVVCFRSPARTNVDSFLEDLERFLDISMKRNVIYRDTWWELNVNF